MTEPLAGTPPEATSFQMSRTPEVPIPEIFPIGFVVTREVLHMMKHHRKMAMSIAQIEMERTNPSALKMLSEAAEALSDDTEEGVQNSVDFYDGIMFAYLVLQTRMGEKDLPTLSDDFVGRYEDFHNELEKDNIVIPGLEFGNVKVLLPKVVAENNASELGYFSQVNIFLATEKEFASQVTNSSKRNRRKNLNPYHSAFFSGAMHTISLFKTGYSDPKNLGGARVLDPTLVHEVNNSYVNPNILH